MLKSFFISENLINILTLSKLIDLFNFKNQNFV